MAGIGTFLGATAGATINALLNAVKNNTSKGGSSSSKNTGSSTSSSRGNAAQGGGSRGTTSGSRVSTSGGSSSSSGGSGGGYTPGYTGTYFADIFADPTNDYNARAYVPGSGWSSITVKDGKTQTTGLPVGTIVETAGGAYRITGTNPDGSYQSVKYTGSVPETAEDKSVYADMYRDGYNSATIGQMVQDHQNGTYTGALNGQQTTTYIDESGNKQTGYVQGSSYLDSMLDELEKQYQAQLEANDSQSAAATKRAILALEQQKLQLNDEYDSLYEQLYLNRRMNEKNLPQQLAALGYTGGLTESSLLNLQNQYQQALREGEQSRLQGMSELDMAIADAQLTGDLERAQNAQALAADYYSNYAQALQALQNQANWQQEFSYQQALAAQQQAEAQRSLAAENGWVLLENGILPDSGTLGAMGLTAEQAQALLDTMGGTAGTQWDYDMPGNDTQTISSYAELGDVAKKIAETMGRGYSSSTNMGELIRNALNAGTISGAEGSYLLSMAGYSGY